jgi:hypothetical protein
MMDDEIVVNGVTDHRQSIRVDLFISTNEMWLGEADGGPLADLIARFIRMLSDVPEEFRSAVRFEQKSEYDKHHPNAFLIYYDRPESDEELKKRIELHENWKTRRIVQLNAEIEALTDPANGAPCGPS